MDGYLLINKPRGFTSHDVVAKVRSILCKASSSQSLVSSHQKLATSDKRLVTHGSKIRVGHTGTLDPLATGLMIIVVGSYTKRAQEFSKMNKTYEVELTLGATSVTGDREGPIKAISNKQIAKSKIEKALESFVGAIMQTPHAHSAIKIGGQRAYKLARAGKDFKIEPRKVTIYDIRNLKIKYPKIWFTTDVSSGTYIRSLAEDIGRKLEVGAYLSSLKRTRIGDYKLEDAISIDPGGIEFDPIKFIRQ